VPDTLRLLALALVMIGIADYAISLVLEHKMLAQARAIRRHSLVLTTAIIVAAFGAGLAVYGLVLTLLGAPSWGAVLYVLCAAHGLHLMMRWPRYVRASEGTPYE
jgi:F0F1-type ATP synthase membrane subunit c/vacuolar-type H+-ATPase subunit K